MSNCSNVQEIITSLNYKLVKSLYVGMKPGTECRHIYKGQGTQLIDDYAYSDNSGDWYVNISRAEADKHFNSALIKPSAPVLDDIEATLKKLDSDLRIIAKRALNFVSDVLLKKAAKL